MTKASTRSNGADLLSTRVVPPAGYAEPLKATSESGTEAPLRLTRMAVRKADPAQAVAATPASREPQVLGGRYVILGVLGHGAVGSVYCAYDQIVRREVAVKVLQTSQRDAQDELLEEARAMAKLSAPHVVKVFEATAEASGRVLLAMEYVEGETLQQWLTHEHTPQEVLAVFSQAGHGLLAAHRAGIVHRDFKPTNVLIAKDGRALVTDFGVAGTYADIRTAASEDAIGLGTTWGGRIRGTPWYMAPEQHLGAAMDPRMDQYAFCVALWEALTNTPLFADLDDPEELIARKHAPLPAWPRQLQVHPAVVKAIYRGLSLRPEERFPDMAELLARLTVANRSRRVFASAALASSALVAAAVAWSVHLERAQRCTGAREHLRDVWDGGQRERMRAAFRATVLPFAEASAERVERALDDFVRRWAHDHREACEATVLRDEHPVEVMDLKMACLQRARVDLRALADVLTSADAAVVEHAHALVNKLPALDACADVDALRSDVPPPREEDAEKVDAARVLLASARVQSQAAKYSAALETVEHAERVLESVAYEPVQAKVAYQKGLVLSASGQYPAAIEHLEYAFETSLAWGMTKEAAEAAAELGTLVGTRQARPAEGIRLATMAMELAKERGRPTREEATAWNALGSILVERGRYEGAETAFMQSLSLWSSIAGPGDLRVAIARNNLGAVLARLGRHEEAEREHRAALLVHEQTLGRAHPTIAASRNNLGLILQMAERYGEAEAEFRHALALYEQALGSDHPTVADTRNNIGTILHDLGRPQEAEAEYRHALRVYEKSLGIHHPVVAESRFNLAMVLDAQGRVGEALEELERARAASTSAPPETRAIVAFEVAQRLWNRESERERAVRLAREAMLDFEAVGPAQREHVARVEQWLGDRGLLELGPSTRALR